MKLSEIAVKLGARVLTRGPWGLKPPETPSPMT